MLVLKKYRGERSGVPNTSFIGCIKTGHWLNWIYDNVKHYLTQKYLIVAQLNNALLIQLFCLLLKTIVPSVISIIKGESNDKIK